MAKRYSKRASKKRAYKKRSTIRKLKTTLRRKMQRGGMVSILTMKLIILVLGLVISSNPTLLSIFTFFVERNESKTVPLPLSNNSSYTQAGGSNPSLLNALNNINQTFNNGNGPTDPNVKQQYSDCMDKLRKDITEGKFDKTTTDAPSVEPLTPDSITGLLENAPAETQAEVSPETEATPIVERVKKIVVTKIEYLKGQLKKMLDKPIAAFKTRYGLAEEDVKCLKQVIGIIVDDILSKKDVLFDEMKKNPRFQSILESSNKVSELAAAGREKASDLAAAGREKVSDLAAAGREKASDLAAAGREKASGFAARGKTLFSGFGRSSTPIKQEATVITNS